MKISGYTVSIIILFVFSIISINSCQPKDSNPTPENEYDNIVIEFPGYSSYNCTEIDDAEITIFCINSDDTYESIGTNASNSETNLLKKIISVFPRKMRERIIEVEFESQDISAGSAGVTPMDDDKIFWSMWINTNPEAASSELEMMQTISHEFMHYLTLNNTQNSADINSCSDMINTLGICPKENSLYHAFIQKFWKPIYDDNIWPEGDYNGYYDDHMNDFVTPYAVTDPGEDIAESFSEFVFVEKPNDLSNIKDQKIDFFWNLTEYVSLRKDIRNKLGL